MSEEVFNYEGFAYVPETDDGDWDGERMTFSFAHRAKAPDGEVVRIPFNPAYPAMERADFEAWVMLGRPERAKPLVRSDFFTDGDLEWLGAIAKAHNVPSGDTMRLAVLARLYGNSTPADLPVHMEETA